MNLFAQKAKTTRQSTEKQNAESFEEGYSNGSTVMLSALLFKSQPKNKQGLFLFWLLCLLALSSCSSLSSARESPWTIQLYSRGFEPVPVGDIILRYAWNGDNPSSDFNFFGNYFTASLSTLDYYFEKIKIEEPDGSVHYVTHLQYGVPSAEFYGEELYFIERAEHFDRRLVMISQPDSQGNIFSMEIYEYPQGDLLFRIDLRSQENYKRVISPNLEPSKIMSMLGFYEHDAIYHNLSIKYKKSQRTPKTQG